MSGALTSILDGIRSLLTWWVTVAPWEQAIRVRGGKHVRLLRPGLYLKVPILDRIYLQCTRLRPVNLPAITVSGDRPGVAHTIVALAEYRVADLLKLYDTLKMPEATVASYAAMKIREIADAGRWNELERPFGLDGLEEFGLSGGRVIVVSTCRVRTLRVMMGDSALYHYGGFTTDSHIGGGPQ